ILRSIFHDISQGGSVKGLRPMLRAGGNKEREPRAGGVGGPSDPISIHGMETDTYWKRTPTHKKCTLGTSLSALPRRTPQEATWARECAPDRERKCKGRAQPDTVCGVVVDISAVTQRCVRCLLLWCCLLSHSFFMHWCARRESSAPETLRRCVTLFQRLALPHYFPPPPFFLFKHQ
ncbi:unnamed protein product, partial [Pylaiella littoralis]